MEFGPTTPVLRIFDEDKAREFYVDFLGFHVDWEHRFEPDLPLYSRVSRDRCVLHLSGHHGDSCPGARVRIETRDLRAFQESLLARNYKHARPGLCEQPWGSIEMTVTDPFGNRLTFFEEIPATESASDVAGSGTPAAQP